MSSFTPFLFAFLVSVISLVTAQVGPQITSPEYNGTITPGETLSIQYNYQNMGNGNYTVDIAVWLDASATQLAANITTDHEIKSGNSTGVALNYTLSDSYDWNVPHGLNETVYLTVTEKANTDYNMSLQLRSRPIMLHVNGGAVALPTVGGTLLAVVLCMLAMFAFN